jgi:uncharacterized protein (DUF1800 family)
VPRINYPLFGRLLLLHALLACALSAAVSPNTALTADEAASRFLAQATFGPSPDSIAELRALNNNFTTWINQQAALPVTLSVPLITAAVSSGGVTTVDRGVNRRARNQVMLTAPDQLRQRMAYALSQIMVISDNDTNVANGLEGPSSYYDMLARNALGSFRTLMMDVTRHPMMGRYLTHYKNRKANTAAGTQPDENYAREVMQLFTIGLYQLNNSGVAQTDSTGRQIETYTNENIAEFAKVFTGFTDENNNPNAVGTGTGRTDFPTAAQNYTQPMIMWEQQHDTSAKTLLNYPGVRKQVLPAGQTGMQDVADALDNLIEHPSTAPFICRQLIQRLVTSNPTDAYVNRVATVFINNGNGQRGDLLAVAKAILLDNEARNVSFITDAEHGKLKEPFLRVANVLRAFRFGVSAGVLPYDFSTAITETTIGQYPLSAPSVFNFYLPDYRPPGGIGNAGLVGPEYQILNSVFAITFPNAIYNLTQTSAGKFSLNMSEQESMSANTATLVENLDLLLTHGMMSAETRTAVTKAVDSVTTAMVPGGSTMGQTKARLAAYLVALSPDSAVLK